MANFTVICEEWKNWNYFYYSGGVVSSAKPLIELFLCHFKSKHDHVIKSRPTKDMNIRDNFNYMAYSYIEKLLKTPIEDGSLACAFVLMTFL